MLNRIKILLFFVSICLASFAQQDSVAFYFGYEFDEGIYLNINQFKSNSPISKQSIISSINKNDIDFFSQLMEQKEIVYKTNTGEEKHITPSSLWGFSQNRAVYVYYNNDFQRLNVIGSICHFSATVRVTMMHTDPMNMNINYPIAELRQFVFKINAPQVVEFTGTNMLFVLKDDTELYNQFSALKRRKREASIFVYLRKYNQRNAFYVPLR